MSLQQETEILHTMKMLTVSLEREKILWKTHRYLNMCSTVDVSGPQRDLAIRWLYNLNENIQFSPETLFTAVSIVDQFLHCVKAHPKYLKVIAIASFYVAIKVIEEYEAIPTIQQFLIACGSSCSISELLRMEILILKKLDWNIKFVTSFDFLHMFHRLLEMNCPVLSGINAKNLTLWLIGNLKFSLLFNKLASFAPSIIALSLLSLGLELICEKWLSLTICLHGFIQNNNVDFMLCRKEMSNIIPVIPWSMNALTDLSASSLIFIPDENSMMHSIKSASKEHTDIEEIYDSIKRLYTDESITSCSASVAFDKTSQVNDSECASVRVV